MSKKKKGLQEFSDEDQKYYEREARLQYGADSVNQSVQRWNSYSEAEQDAIKLEGDQIYMDLADAMDAGRTAKDKEVTDILDRWQNHIRYFYEPSLDTLRGLGQLYNSHEGFIKNFQNIHADLPAYLEQVIDYYVDELETAELERMLVEDEEMEQRRNNLSR